LCYKDFTRNQITRATVPWGKYWKRLYFWTCLVREDFTFYSSFFNFLTTKGANIVKKGATAKNEGGPMCCIISNIAIFAYF
jgi:hypothetical protein